MNALNRFYREARHGHFYTRPDVWLKVVCEWMSADVLENPPYKEGGKG